MPELKQDFLIDTTLRDGEQAAGLVFSSMEKMAIAIALDKAGIGWIEAGTPVMGPEEAEAMRLILDAGLKATVFSWNRACARDITASLACGFEFLHISVPVSDLHIYHKLKQSRKWVFEQLTRAVFLARSHGCQVSVGAEDASRAEFNQFLELAEISERLGAVRIRYADTVGLLEPFRIREIISRLATYCSLPIEFHAHNDFGLATANTVTALQSGARYASVTAAGIGERAGNAALEEVLAVLATTNSVPTGINLAAAKKIGCQVAAMSKRQSFFLPDDESVRSFQ